MKLSRIGVLDFGSIGPGATASTVLKGTVERARIADKLGYSRYWLGEHHTPSTAWASPSILLPVIGCITRKIRLGSAGVLLRVNNPLHVAQAYTLLATLFPGRVDCGLAAGFVPNDLLSEFGVDPVKKDEFQLRLNSLLKYINKDFSLGHTLVDGVAPIGTEFPPIWLMGVNSNRRELASKLSTAYCYSLIHRGSSMDAEQLTKYKQDFIGSARLKNPVASIAVSICCAATESGAKKIASEFLNPNFHDPFCGTSGQCLDYLEQLAQKFVVDEIVIQFIGSDQQFLADSCRDIGETFTHCINQKQAFNG